MDNSAVVNTLDKGVGQFVAEASIDVTDVTPLFDVSEYPEDQRELINECNRRIDEANNKYRIAKFREDMFAKGLKAGMTDSQICQMSLTAGLRLLFRQKEMALSSCSGTL